MQAVILCAGRGTRMGELSKNTPKVLLEVGGRTLLEHKFDALPDEVSEIVLTIGHKGEMVREKFGSSYKDRKITYREDKTLTGTAHSLWTAKDILRDRFLVMMGDDIYDAEAMADCAKYDFSIACKQAEMDESGSRVLFDEGGNLIDFVTYKMYRRLKQDSGLIFTGLYSLTTDIFDYEPIKLELKDEWGLPQTLLKAAKDHPVTIVETDFWLPVGTPEELVEAEKALI